MNITNSGDKEPPQEKKSQGAEEPLEKEIAEIKPPEETLDAPLEEKTDPPAEAMPHSEEIAEVKPKIKRKPNRKPRPKYQSQVSAPLKKWKRNG